MVGMVQWLTVVMVTCIGISNDDIDVVCSLALIVLPQPSFMLSQPPLPLTHAPCPLSCSPIRCSCSHYLLFVWPHLLSVCACLCLFSHCSHCHLTYFVPCPHFHSCTGCAPYRPCSWCCCCCCSYSHADASPAAVPTSHTHSLPHPLLMRLLQLQLQLRGCFLCCRHCCWMHACPLAATIVIGHMDTLPLLLLLLPLCMHVSSCWPLVRVCLPCTGLSSVCSLPVKAQLVLSVNCTYLCLWGLR